MAKLDCKSLMIGDWVNVKLTQHPTTVTNIDGNSVYTEAVFPLRYDEIEPILLTKEILEKNEFVLSKKSSVSEEFIYALDRTPDNVLFINLFISRDLAKVYYSPLGVGTMIDVNIPHCAVHQLQHALRLCGIEKKD